MEGLSQQIRTGSGDMEELDRQVRTGNETRQPDEIKSTDKESNRQPDGRRVLLCPESGERRTPRFEEILSEISHAWEDSCLFIDTTEKLRLEIEEKDSLRNSKILFAVALNSTGMNLELYRMLQLIRKHSDCLEESISGILVDGQTELYTKAVAGEIALTINGAGCRLPGRPLVEGTGSLNNFDTMARNLGCDYMDAYRFAAGDLAKRLIEFTPVIKEKPQILCLHSSNPKTSNTLWLWEQVKKYLPEQSEVREVSLRNGAVRDCAGCSFDTCMYFSRNSSCYYGGTIVEEVYPALKKCDALVLLCPNYNDALGANLTAMINRLTALFRQKPFFEKQLFALIVSGYSGGDLVAKQLIDSLNMNKSFQLPPRFALFQSANAPGSIAKIDGIHREAKVFAEHMTACLTRSDI